MKDLGKSQLEALLRPKSPSNNKLGMTCKCGAFVTSPQVMLFHECKKG